MNKLIKFGKRIEAQSLMGLWPLAFGPKTDGRAANLAQPCSPSPYTHLGSGPSSQWLGRRSGPPGATPRPD